MPNYPQNVRRPSTTYKPPFTPNNAFQPNIEGQSFNQTQSQGYGQGSNSREKVVKFTPIPMTYTKLLPDLLKNTLVAICPAGLYNHHIPDIMTSMQSVNIMV